MANQKRPEDIEKDRRSNGLKVLAVFAGAGLLISIALFFESGLGNALICFGGFAGLGALIFAIIKGRQKTEDNWDIAMRDPSSPQYAKQMQRINMMAEQLRAKMYKHGSLKDEYSMASMIVIGIIFGIVLLINLIMFLFGYYSIWAILILVIMLVMFIVSLRQPGYKKILDKYMQIGALPPEAEEDFAHAAMMRGGSLNITAVGAKYTVSTEGEQTVIRTADIVWAFPRMRYTYNYYNGVYTGRSTETSIVLCTAQGGMHVCCASLEGCYVFMDILSDMNVVCGYADSLYQLYKTDPSEFAVNAGKNSPLPEIHTFLMPQLAN
ncbi:MAG: hypothetical protein II782_08165 [Oscillospiraceae bacterium]|nr:hypothetical protein [Oscillospiraceae bacterium]